MSKDEARRAAARAGLVKLTESDLGLLARSIEANTGLATRLPKDLHWSEEIAPALRLANRGTRGQDNTGKDGQS